MSTHVTTDEQDRTTFCQARDALQQAQATIAQSQVALEQAQAALKEGQADQERVTEPDNAKKRPLHEFQRDDVAVEGSSTTRQQVEAIRPADDSGQDDAILPSLNQQMTSAEMDVCPKQTLGGVEEHPTPLDVGATAKAPSAIETGPQETEQEATVGEDNLQLDIAPPRPAFLPAPGMRIVY